MFPSLRIQWIEPCRARCERCATWPKNAAFQTMIDRGADRKLHDFYLDAVREFRPQSLYISGGEPLLSPGIGDYLHAFSPLVGGRIFMFCSFQFGDDERRRLLSRDWPEKNVVLTHTMTGFDPVTWSRQTNDFPFDLYVRNLRELSASFPRKRIKLILNHDDVPDQLERFVEAVRPDSSFVFSLKLINLQGGHLQADVIEATRRRAMERLGAREDLYTQDLRWRTDITGERTLAALADHGDATACPYRLAPTELRFAFRSHEEDRIRLYYRFCPFFPPEGHFGFHLGHNTFDHIRLAYARNKWHSWCPNCRLRRYCEPSIP
jgi:uncharacterized Fe-S cluster-containing radical SAM superfamily protein